MNNVDNSLNKIVIVGGGIVGWSIAAAISHNDKNCQVLLIDLPEEDNSSYSFNAITACLPSIKKFHQDIGVNERALKEQVDVSFSLGTQYKGWGKNSTHDFFIPFSDHGFMLKGIEFPNYIMRLHKVDETIGFDEYALATHASRSHKFCHPSKDARSLFSTIEYGLHLNTQQYSVYLSKHALKNGVTKMSASNVGINFNANTADIESLSVKNENNNTSTTTVQVTADFYIDCSRQGLLSKSASGLNNDTQNQERNRKSSNNEKHPIQQMKSIGVVIKSKTDIPPNSELKSIPLSTSTINETPHQLENSTLGSAWVKTLHLANFSELIFYFTPNISEHQAFTIIDTELGINNNANILSITPFLTDKCHDISSLSPWRTNYLTLGKSVPNSDIFFTPKLHLIQADILRFLALYPTKSAMSFYVAEYNKLSLKEIEHTQAFNELHFLSLNDRLSDQWKNNELNHLSPNNTVLLQEKLNLYSVRGKIPLHEGDTISAQHWQGFLMGNQCWPQEYDPMADIPDFGWLKSQLDKMKKSFHQAAQAMPKHTDYLMDKDNHA